MDPIKPAVNRLLLFYIRPYYNIAIEADCRPHERHILSIFNMAGASNGLAHGESAEMVSDTMADLRPQEAVNRTQTPTLQIDEIEPKTIPPAHLAQSENL